MNNYIINKSVRNDYIKEKERSSYRYGMDVLILILIPIFIILVILVVTRNIEFAILFLLFFIPILFIKFNKHVRYLNFLPLLYRTSWFKKRKLLWKIRQKYI